MRDSAASAMVWAQLLWTASDSSVCSSAAGGLTLHAAGLPTASTSGVPAEVGRFRLGPCRWSTMLKTLDIGAANGLEGRLPAAVHGAAWRSGVA